VKNATSSYRQKNNQSAVGKTIPLPVVDMNPTDTIAAIASPLGTAGIGVIRISGPGARSIAARIFRSPKGNVGEFGSHTAHYGSLVDPDTEELIDEVVATVFWAPNSYTGEDVVEISCHGGLAVLKRALDAVLRGGARLAEPGEFTRRAFLNGRIDLAQAEAVNDLIRARTDNARRAALRQLEGRLSKTIRGISDRLLGVIAAIEASIDFPDDVDEPDNGWMREEILTVKSSLEELIGSFDKGRIYREGLRVVIAGRVNVGKSSLLNALLRHARAIVTPIPGTTRDVIEENIEIHGIPVVAIDTAGIRTTDDPVEKIGVELTQAALESADLILVVIDASEDINQADMELLNQLKNRPVVVVLNKIDLVSEESRDSKISFFQGLERNRPVVLTCASSGQGIEELENTIATLVASGDIESESAIVTNARHLQLLKSALNSLQHSLDTLESGEPIDFLSVDLSAARNSLGMITGEAASEDLIDRIFSEFCIGK